MAVTEIPVGEDVYRCDVIQDGFDEGLADWWEEGLGHFEWRGGHLIVDAREGGYSAFYKKPLPADLLAQFTVKTLPPHQQNNINLISHCQPATPGRSLLHHPPVGPRSSEAASGKAEEGGDSMERIVDRRERRQTPPQPTEAREDDEAGSIWPIVELGRYPGYRVMPNYIVTFVGAYEREDWGKQLPDGRTRLRRDPEFHLIQETNRENVFGRPYTVTFTALAGRIRYYIDGEQIHDWTDPAPIPAAGYFALRTYCTVLDYSQILFARTEE